jgi:hypothetical protein
MQFVMKFHFLCFSFFNPSYPLSDNTHVHNSVTMHFKEMFVKVSQPLMISNQELNQGRTADSYNSQRSFIKILGATKQN